MAKPLVHVHLNGPRIAATIKAAAAATTVAAPEMVTRQAVPLVRTGSYVLVTGPVTFTEEDLKAAVAAYANDPAIHAPRIKIDGLAESFNPEAHGGEPAVGTVTNLRCSADGQTLLGDCVIPKWLDKIADWAYPNRSVEGAQGVVMPGTGQKHDFVVTAVALLGVDLPGVNTLPDLADLLANGPEGGEPVAEPAEVIAASGWKGTPVRAGMDQDIVRRRFYESIEADASGLPEGVSMFDLWVVAIRFDDGGKPYLKAIDEASGRLYRVDFSISGNEVSFDGWQEVAEQDVPVAAGAPRPRTVKAWASRAESRPTPIQEEHDMDIAALREAAGLTAEQLPDDATPEQVAAALRTAPEAEAPSDEAAQAEAPTPDEKPANEQIAASASLPEGMVVVDKATLDDLKAGAATAQDLKARQDREERDRIITAAMLAGKFGKAQKERFVKLYDSDPEGTRHLLTAKAEDGGLAEGVVPTSQVGASPQDDNQDDNRGTGLFPELHSQGA